MIMVNYEITHRCIICGNTYDNKCLPLKFPNDDICQDCDDEFGDSLNKKVAEYKRNKSKFNFIKRLKLNIIDKLAYKKYRSDINFYKKEQKIKNYRNEIKNK